MKKRKILFFANIAILCLSVFIFVFGIYAANNAHVKSGGTIKFAATNIYAKITRTVSGHDTSKGNVIASESKIIDARTETTDGSTVLSFDDEMYFDKNPTEIVMTFTIENLSSKRNLDFSFTRNNATQTNISDVATVSANMYDTTNKIYNVNPKVDNVNNIETITIKFNVEDWEASGILDYDYTINLSNQTTTSSNIQSTSNLTRAGNTYVATNTLATGNQLSYSVEGTTSYHEYAPVITNTNTITSAFHVYGTDVTGITATTETIDTSFTITKTSEGNASIKAKSTSAISTNVVLPTAVNTTTDGIMIISSLTESAFYNCTKLTTIRLPATLTSINTRAFSRCDNLTEVIVDSNNPRYASAETKNMVIELSTNTLVVGLNNVTEIPDNISVIGDFAFHYCTNLALTSLPESITIIGKWAFSYCDSLALTSLPSRLTIIGEYALTKSKNLALTSLPESITTIGKYAFQGCTNLALTSLPKNLTTIEDNTFYNCTNLALTSLPESIKTIWNRAFYNCPKLVLTSLPEGLTTIDEWAFYNCTSLTKITISASIMSIGSLAFSNCTSLKTITFAGTKAQWEVLNANNKAKFTTGAVVTCSVGTVTY